MARRFGNTVLFGLMPQAMFFVGVALFESPPLWLFYLLLLFAVWNQQWWYERDNQTRVIQSEHVTLRSVPPQAVAGALVGIAITAPLTLFASFRVGPDFGRELATQILFVGFVETYDMVVTVRTIPHGELLWPFKFAAQHWYVRDAVAAGDLWRALFAIAYTALFGVLFYVLYDARREHGPWFGPVTAWSAHVGINLMLILFPLALLDFALVPV